MGAARGKPLSQKAASLQCGPNSGRWAANQAQSWRYGVRTAKSVGLASAGDVQSGGGWYYCPIRQPSGGAPMLRVFATFAALLALYPLSAKAQDASAALIAICDQAAASPLDKNRPADVAGVVPDKIEPKIAIPACEAALKAAPNDPRIMFQLGRAYFAAKAYESARTQYAKADEIGYPLAANNLASIYGDGLGVVADGPRSMTLLEKAANGGVGLAMNNLGVKYLNGSGVSKDAIFARAWFRKGAEAGNIDAMNEYGVMVYNGLGGSKDLSEARRWFRKAADDGNIYALRNYGDMLKDGEGGEKNLIEARQVLQKAAIAGNRDAAYSFGVMLRDGEGGVQNENEARHWLGRAAEADHDTAMNYYAWMLLKGVGGAKDEAEARRWFQKGAAKGDHYSMTTYGWMLNNGHGGPADRTAAKLWYEKAAALGNETAKENLRLMAASRKSAGRQDSGWKRGFPPGYKFYRPGPYGLGWNGSPCYVPGTPGC